MVAVAIMGFLFALGLPAFNTYLANTKLRTTAESFLAGVQQARAEAVRRNANVQFTLTNDLPTPDSVATVNAVANGQNWLIRTADLSTFIEAKTGAEGTGGNQSSASQVQINSGGVSAITFNGLGGSTLGAVAVFQFSNPTGGNCKSATPSGPMRCLNVTVSIGGQARLCDPAVDAAAIAAGDTRGC
ncbi:hypothetical protein DLREEDagrD3_07770 [Denitratisoma sp. agr-D3]